MKIAISNIAWCNEQDEFMYEQLKERGIKGLEIAPTRIVPEHPYDHIADASNLAKRIRQYGLEICSMQSIWFGKTENIFESAENRQNLLEYTKKAILFAEAVGCPNLVFGSPKNRNIPLNANPSWADDFFRELGDFAKLHHTTLALEPNPTIYNTNFLNTTEDTLRYVEKIHTKGLMINYDFGTCLANNEVLDIVKNNIETINHIHISEPFLSRIEKRELHKELARILKDIKYDRYVSIEMKKQDDISDVLNTIEYIMEVFN